MVFWFISGPEEAVQRCVDTGCDYEAALERSLIEKYTTGQGGIPQP